MKIGIYGGTFNPIHKGHIFFAETAINKLNLDKIILIPNNIPPHKSNENTVSPYHRFNMCCLAARSNEKIIVSDIEIKRSGVSFTVDTLRELRKIYPHDQLFLLLGTDTFCTLQKWKCYKEVLTLACPIGAPREASHLPMLQKQQKALKNSGFNSVILPLTPIEVSSTEIRKGDEDELDSFVLKYIEQNMLYDCPLKFSIDLDKIQLAVKNKLSKKRYIHSVNVANEALVLAELNGYDKTSAYIAGLLHDYMKEIPYPEMLQLITDSDIINDKVFLASPKIWHGFAASYAIPKLFCIYSHEILNAICYHSTACKNMSLLDKIIYMADLLSEERNYDGVNELREKTHKSLDDGLKEALEFSITSLTKQKKPLIFHTVNAYNDLVLEKT